MWQEIRQKPEPGENVGTEDVVSQVIELPSISAIEQMIQTGQSHCTINGVRLQNGVTTTQVLLTVMVVWWVTSVIFVTKIKTRTRIVGRRFQRTRTRIIVIQKTKTK